MAEKIKLELEYLINTSPNMLYARLTTPSGLSEWFADDVNIKDDIFSFYWDGSEEQARLVSYKTEGHIRFQWLEDEGSDYYFEFKIQIDSLTKEVALIVIDFADEDEKEEVALLWERQVNDLIHNLGA
ncbi:MAG: START-like domain-containing protein [Flavobacteriales bacterium]|nr:START-like domain-containing protein [Flavobacteriales bacterium]